MIGKCNEINDALRFCLSLTFDNFAFNFTEVSVGTFGIDAEPQGRAFGTRLNFHGAPAARCFILARHYRIGSRADHG